MVCCFAELARCSSAKGLLFPVIMEMIKLFEDPTEPVRVAILKQVGSRVVDTSGLPVFTNLLYLLCVLLIVA